MSLASLLQIVAACLGIIGSMFFGIGVMRQSVSNMAAISGTYFDYNPSMITAVAAQKADYLFGGCIIVFAFSTQLASFMVPDDVRLFSPEVSNAIPWIALVSVVVLFVVLARVAKLLGRRFEAQIRVVLQQRSQRATVANNDGGA